MKMTRAQATELKELIEDVVECFCDQHQLSGESTWTAVETLSVAKYVCFAGAVSIS